MAWLVLCVFLGSACGRIGFDEASTNGDGPGGGGADVAVSNPDSLTTCPAGYILVPGNNTYNTSNFCVMKYESKKGSITVSATTQAEGLPVVNISQREAKIACELNGPGFGLITNAEWMTAARNIEAQAVNWTGGTVGSGGLWRGHSDGSPGASLASSTDDGLGYTGTEQATPSAQKRTHTLSNGEVIWDFSGNLWEWTDDTILDRDQPSGSTAGFTFREYTDIISWGSLGESAYRPSDSTWNSSQNMGQINSDGTSRNDTTHTFRRGGYWASNALAGVLALHQNDVAPYADGGIGMRCVLR